MVLQSVVYERGFIAFSLLFSLHINTYICSLLLHCNMVCVHFRGLTIYYHLYLCVCCVYRICSYQYYWLRVAISRIYLCRYRYTSPVKKCIVHIAITSVFVILKKKRKKGIYNKEKKDLCEDSTDSKKKRKTVVQREVVESM